MPANVLALFDLDHTLLTRDSDEAWVEYLVEQGALDRDTFEQASRNLIQRYRKGEAGTLEFTEFYLSTLVGHDVATLTRWRADYLTRKIAPAISAQARALVERHRAVDDLMVMTTATSSFLTTPIAAELGFEHLIATEPVIAGGRYNGKVAGIPNMREGKVTRLEAWLAERGQKLRDFSQTWFYSDSRNDIPLLSAVSHPVAVNPDTVLAAMAYEKQWPILQIG